MSINTKQKVGVAIIVLSLLAGVVGSLLSVAWAFWSLESVENQGIGAVGVSLKSGLAFALVGLLGTLGGGALLIFGRSKAD